METMKELKLEEMEIVSGGISKKEKMRRRRLKKFREKNPPVIRKLGCESDKPAQEESSVNECFMNLSEYLDAHKEEFIFNFPSLDFVLQ